MGKGKERYKKPLVNKPQLKTVRPKPQSAFTLKFKGKTNRIVTEVGICPAFDPKDYIGKDPPFKMVRKHALWDTSATNSVLTVETVKQLGLIPIGKATVSHGGGTGESLTYLVNFGLPNAVGIHSVIVTECPVVVGPFEAIIGMDIITAGDLALTNANNQTCMSFCIPSLHTIDFVEEINHQVKANT